MKKKLAILGILIITALLCIVIFNKFMPKSYKEIDFKEYMELFESEEKFVLFIGSNNCSHCTTFKKTATRIVKDFKIKINYIDLDKLTESEYAHINAHFPFKGTPTTIIVQNGEEIERIDGAKSYSLSVEKLKKSGVIKE